MRFAVIVDSDLGTEPVAVVLHTGSYMLLVSQKKYHTPLRNAFNREYAVYHKVNRSGKMMRHKVHFSEDGFLEAVKQNVRPPFVMKYIGNITNNRAMAVLVNKFLPKDVEYAEAIKIVPTRVTL